MSTARAASPVSQPDPETEAGQLNAVFFALSDPVRREILNRLKDEAMLVSELAKPFDISLQAVSRHIQVLVKAGLVRQERTGRISRCSLEVGPIFTAAVWINGYTRYWQAQFDALADFLETQTDQDPADSEPGSAPPDTSSKGS